MNTLRIATLLLALLQILQAQPDRFGTPSCAAPDHELADRTYYTLCYSVPQKLPQWVGYELTPEQLQKAAARPAHFRRDTELASPAATNADYLHSGYNRGHLAPAADFAFSTAAIRSTFLLSNVIPQDPRANSGRWSQLESAVRKLTANADAAYIFSGPLFESPEPERIGPNRIPVPTHTFKVVLLVAGGRKTMYAAIIPNTAAATEPLAAYTTTVAEVEGRTGLDFFSALEDQQEHYLETTRELFQH